MGRTIGAILSTLRHESSMNLKDVALKTGLSISYLSDLERDRTEPSIKTLRLLASAYDVKPSYLLDESIPPESQNNEIELYLGGCYVVITKKQDRSIEIDIESNELSCHLDLTGDESEMLRNALFDSE